MFFARFGELVEATVILNRSTGQSRGFGFVSFRNSTDANQAIAGTDGVELDGRPIKVNRAETASWPVLRHHGPRIGPCYWAERA